MTDAELQALADRLNAMPPPSRLIVAATLMEAAHGDIALPIIRRVADELELALTLRKSLDQRKP